MPDKEAQVLALEKPLIKVVEGPIYSRVEVDLPGVVHSITLHSSPGMMESLVILAIIPRNLKSFNNLYVTLFSGVDSVGLEIINKVDITQFANFEMVMRLSSNVRSKDEFFTDLNGLQV